MFLHPQLWGKLCKFTEKCENFTEINVKFTEKKSGKKVKSLSIAWPL